MLISKLAMKQMEEYKLMLARLNALITALENGELSLDELVELEETTRKLHERSIILKYNAFKESVSPKQELPENEAAEVAEEEPVPEVIEEPEPEEQAFDFSIFEDNDEETESVESAISEPIEEVAETVEVEEVKEEIAQEITPETEPEVIAEPEIKPEPEPEVETPSEENAIPSSDATKEFLSKLKANNNSLGGHFAKLSSLIGAFGLNERLRFINDLFDGSSETFSDAIKSLDGLPDLNSARNKAAEFAVKFDWDPEEEVVAEFMHYLSRRYA